MVWYTCTSLVSTAWYREQTGNLVAAAGCVTAHVTEGGSHAKAVTWWAVSCAGETPGCLASSNPTMGVSELIRTYFFLYYGLDIKYMLLHYPESTVC